LKIAFAGMGAMGAPMAANLAAAGHTVTSYRRPAKPRAPVPPAAPEGVRLATDLAAMLREAEILVTMLPNDAAVREVASAALELTGGGIVHCAMSTVSAELARELTAASTARGVGYVAAPVFGRPDAAAAKALWIVAAGEADHVARCEPLFGALGRGVTHAGSEPYRANLIKIAGNLMIVSMIETLAEVIALMRATGVAPDLFLEVVEQVFRSPILTNYGAQIAERRFEPAGFKLELGLKDVRLALAEGDAAQTVLPLASLVRDHLLAAVANGDGERDWTAMSQVVGRLANLDSRPGTW